MKVLEDGHLEDGVEHYRGCTGTVDHIVESTPELIFYGVAFSGSWDKGYIHQEALKAVHEEDGMAATFRTWLLGKFERLSTRNLGKVDRCSPKGSLGEHSVF